MRGLYISGAHKSSGKTTVTLGLCAALLQRGISVQPFKKGPDFIDPIWLLRAARRPCFNLDFNTSDASEIVETFASHGDADLSLVEGNKGLHDGLSLDGSDSNAALAKLLDLPVILVIDTRGITRSVAPLLLGYQTFDPGVRVAGVILNQVGGSRHEAKLRSAVEQYTDLKVVGAVQRSTDCAIEERHLGLMPANELASAEAIIKRIRELVAAQVDLDLLLSLAVDRPNAAPAQAPQRRSPVGGLRIGYALDAAFGFYYPDDLERFGELGVELVPVNMLTDRQLPELDGLFIGGGFPETHMGALAANQSMRKSVADAIEGGLPTYAECGGLMYLTRSIMWRGERAEMCGVLPADAVMSERPQGRGLVVLEETENRLWPGAPANRVIRAHEFHHSTLVGLPSDVRYAYKVLRGSGIHEQFDGLVYKNLVANYSHLRNQAQNPWVDRFVAFVRQCRDNRSTA